MCSFSLPSRRAADSNFEGCTFTAGENFDSAKDYDCNIYVASERAGVGLLQSLTRFLSERLKLKVNTSKSAVARPWARKFLGSASQ